MTIGIPGWNIGPNSFGVTTPYLEFIKEYIGAEDIRILMPYSPLWNDLDLVVLPGGADINPSRYAEPPGFYTDKCDIIKEYFDVYILPQYIELGIPIFGICRGAQALAVHFGAKLWQNIWHETNRQENPYEAVHGIKIVGEEKRKVEVNSRHHQSIKIPTGDTPIQVLAYHSAINWHIEAIKIQDRPIIGVQWHPEDLNKDSGVEYTLRLIESIIKK